MVWGGAEDQAKEIQAGNMDAKNWQDEVLKILQTTVSHTQLSQTTSVIISKLRRWRSTIRPELEQNPLFQLDSPDCLIQTPDNQLLAQMNLYCLSLIDFTWGVSCAITRDGHLNCGAT